jgi:penicillin-binding protein 1A
MGFTGNYVCGVWVGNDDYQSTKKMTGGSLPAMIWHDIMAYAHQGIELKNIPGVAPGPTPPPPAAVAEATASTPDAPPPRPALLTRRAADVLQRVEHMMEDATRGLAETPPAGTKSSDARTGGTLASSADRSGARGN